MDLEFEQKALKTTARDFLEKECPKTLLRALSKDKVALPAALYARMAELGWFGLIVPAEYGGTEGTFFDMVILLEEMGRACLPGPFFSSAVIGVLTLLWSGSEEQRREYLPRLAEGKTYVTLALTEPSAAYQASAIELTAATGPDGYLLNGTKLFVPQANLVDHIIVAARTGEAPDPRENVSLFLVDVDSAGLRINQLETVTHDGQCAVVFDDVHVPRTGLMGQANDAWPIVERLLSYAAVGLCARMVGGAQKALEMTVDYAKSREQFGHSIGSFQAIQQLCANMLIDVDAAKYVTYKAAWALSEGETGCETLASVAKAWTTDAYLRVTQMAHRVHGAIAFSEDYDLQFYIKEAVSAAPSFGDADFHREKVAEMIYPIPL